MITAVDKGQGIVLRLSSRRSKMKLRQGGINYGNSLRIRSGWHIAEYQCQHKPINHKEHQLFSRERDAG